MSRCVTKCLCGFESQVIDSRENSESVRRRRKCISCGHRWTTYEVLGQDAPFVTNDMLAKASRMITVAQTELSIIRESIESMIKEESGL